MVEQQVHAKVAVADLEEHLPADEGEAGPHLQQVCSSLLHDFAVGPGGRKGAHVLEVAGRESSHVRERLPEVVRKAVDGPGAPAFTLLAGENRLADVPVEQHHRLVGGQHDAHAFRADAFLDLNEQRGVVSGQLSQPSL